MHSASHLLTVFGRCSCPASKQFSPDSQPASLHANQSSQLTSHPASQVSQSSSLTITQQPGNQPNKLGTHLITPPTIASQSEQQLNSRKRTGGQTDKGSARATELQSEPRSTQLTCEAKTKWICQQMKRVRGYTRSGVWEY